MTTREYTENRVTAIVKAVLSWIILDTNLEIKQEFIDLTYPHPSVTVSTQLMWDKLTIGGLRNLSEKLSGILRNLNLGLLKLQLLRLSSFSEKEDAMVIDVYKLYELYLNFYQGSSRENQFYEDVSLFVKNSWNGKFIIAKEETSLPDWNLLPLLHYTSLIEMCKYSEVQERFGKLFSLDKLVENLIGDTIL